MREHNLAFSDALVAKARLDRLPELFVAPPPEALYLTRREGIVVIALRQRHFDPAQLATILRYRLVNRMLYGEVSAELVSQYGVEYEWWFPGSGDDVHVVVASAESGELVAYLMLHFLAGAIPEMTLRTETRPRFVAEDVFGSQVFHDVPGLAEWPLTSIAEMMRFTRAHWLPTHSPLGVRGTIEAGVALFHLMTGPLAPEVFALLADVTERGAQHNLDFFNIPMIALREARPVEHMQLAYPRKTEGYYPIVLLTSAFPKIVDRVAALEAMLSLPGNNGIRALLQARKSGAG